MTTSKGQVILILAKEMLNKAQALGLRPSRFVIGYLAEIEMEHDIAYCLIDVWRANSTLFGIPVKITNTDEWLVNLEVEELKADVSIFFEGADYDKG